LLSEVAINKWLPYSVYPTMPVAAVWQGPLSGLAGFHSLFTLWLADRMIMTSIQEDLIQNCSSSHHHHYSLATNIVCTQDSTQPKTDGVSMMNKLILVRLAIRYTYTAYRPAMSSEAQRQFQIPRYVIHGPQFTTVLLLEHVPALIDLHRPHPVPFLNPKASRTRTLEAFQTMDECNVGATTVCDNGPGTSSNRPISSYGDQL
jgi:hypothetical protein